MQEKIESIDKEVGALDKEVGVLDKEIALLNLEYKTIMESLDKTNKQLVETNKLLNTCCTKLEKQSVRVDGLEEDLKRYQQLTYGVIVGVVVFVIQQVVMMIH